MATATDRLRTQPIIMVVTVVAMLLGLGYGTIAVTTGDWLWFRTQFDDRPSLIIVYHHNGKRTQLRTDEPGFDELESAIRASLTEGLVRPSGIGFSDASLLDAYSQYVTVEAFFDRPVRLHAWFDTGHPTRMLFPITGRHSDLNLVLLGQGSKYLSSPPVLETVEPIRQALRSLGYY